MPSLREIRNKKANAPIRDPARLESYIQQSYMALGFVTSIVPEIFKPTNRHPGPLLCKDVVNRILFYRGRFDPPHYGHLGVLEHGMVKSGQDLNIVAAVVVPMDVPESLESWKREWHDEDSRCYKPLTIEERGRLWETEGPSFYWVFKRSYLDFKAFQSRLIKYTANAGFQVEFIGVVGPDHVVSVERRWVARAGMIVSDISRDALFFNSGKGLGVLGIPSAIKGYYDWELMEGDQEIWECRRKDDVRKFIKFLPAKTKIAPEGEEFSGTDIRDVLTVSRKEDIKWKLIEKAMNVDVLIQMLEDRKWFRD